MDNETLKILFNFFLELFIYLSVGIGGIILGYFILTRFSNGEENWHDPSNPPADWERKDE